MTLKGDLYESPLVGRCVEIESELCTNSISEMFPVKIQISTKSYYTVLGTFVIYSLPIEALEKRLINLLDAPIDGRNREPIPGKYTTLRTKEFLSLLLIEGQVEFLGVSAHKTKTGSLEDSFFDVCRIE